ncbi:molecular chaperone DnaJ [Halocatena marina]|uniref:Chaperone protein DnaJ n=1 Tax=Halocatena marina TaxID=2934937 RepID=A0ABD5YUE2_9EURY|nr:molecular chaperone DnaJ [Halocatena marina]
MSEDFYDVLGVSRDASEDEIKSAYREKASKYHPDVSDDPNAEEKFKQAKKAKEVLTDDEARQAYDQLGHDRFEEAEKRGGFGGGGAGGDPFGGFGGNGGPFGDMNDIFEQFFGGRQRQGNATRQGRDLQTRLTIELEDAYHGTEKQMTINRPERCSDCNGKGHPPDADAQTCSGCNGSGQQTRVQQTPLGRVQQTMACPECEGSGTIYSTSCSACHGDGQVMNEATLMVDIPAGISSGQTLRLEREGAPGENGGPNGDLLVEITVESHADFEREGDDLIYRLPISFPQAVFGDELEVPTVDGAATFDIPKGTQSGETFRLQGKGMPRLRRRGSGDLYVYVQVVTPESLNEEQRESLKAFAEAGGEEIDVSEGFFEKIKNSL